VRDREMTDCQHELTIHFDLAFVAFKSFAIVGDVDIAHTKPK